MPIRGQRFQVAAAGLVSMAELAQADLSRSSSRPSFAHRPMPVPRVPSTGASPTPPVPLGLPSGPEPQGPPAKGNSFRALLDDQTSAPPDTNGAVGPNHVVTMLNSQVRVQSRNGNILSTVSLESFWSSTGAQMVFDPRTAYDPLNKRWVAAAGADPDSPQASLLVGVSLTANPTGSWKLYRIDVDPTDQLWLDFPSLGFNTTWVVVHGNMYDSTGTFTQSNLYVIDKASLLAAGDTLHYSVISDATIQDTLVPAETYDTTTTTLYLLQNWSGNQNGAGVLRLYTITGAVGAEQLTPVTFIPVQDPWDSMAPNGGADFAPQLGSIHTIATNDDRLGNTVLRNGKLWTTHTVHLPAGAPTRSAVQWWQIQTDGTVLQRGRLEDPTGERFYGYGSIAVNRNDDVLIGYSRFSPQQYASAYFSFRQVSDPANTLQPDTLMKAGVAAYYKLLGGSENRWGDYSRTVVDPVDDTALWTLQEYAALPAGNQSRWGTWWTQVIPPAPTCGADGAPCSDGNACTLGDVCKAGVCIGGTAIPCPADACHTASTCNPATGTCNNALPDGTPCSDNNACTTDDVCKAGTCTGTTVACPPLDACHATGTCDTTTGMCNNAAKPDGMPCDDGNPCTTGEVCTAGACLPGAPRSCPATDACHDDGLCDPSNGLCILPPKANGTPCDDGNLCTSGEVCTGGVCIGGFLECPPPGDCLESAGCDPTTGACVTTPQADGTPCAFGQCANGVCSGTTTSSASSSSEMGGTGGGATTSGNSGGAPAKPDTDSLLYGRGCSCEVPAAGDRVPYPALAWVLWTCAGRLRRRRPSARLEPPAG